MAMNWPTFFTRLGSAMVFAAVMMCGLLWKVWMFLALAVLIMVLCLREYFKLMQLIEDTRTPRWLIAFTHILSLAFFALAVMYRVFNTGDCPMPPDTEYSELTLFIGMLVAVIFPISMLLVTGLSTKYTFKHAFQAFGGMLYVALPITLLMVLYSKMQYLPLILILCIWMNDTMAYIVGSFIGKTPFSKISPKKTWEGTIGGALLTVVGAAVAAHFIPHQSMPLYIALALCAAIAGTAGDLFESKLKRMAGVKDSGTMMPGHGGALDRFDSLLVATPFAFCAVYLVQAFT